MIGCRDGRASLTTSTNPHSVLVAATMALANVEESIGTDIVAACLPLKWQRDDDGLEVVVAFGAFFHTRWRPGNGNLPHE